MHATARIILAAACEQYKFARRHSTMSVPMPNRRRNDGRALPLQRSLLRPKPTIRFSSYRARRSSLIILSGRRGLRFQRAVRLPTSPLVAADPRAIDSNRSTGACLSLQESRASIPPNLGGRPDLRISIQSNCNVPNSQTQKHQRTPPFFQLRWNL